MKLPIKSIKMVVTKVVKSGQHKVVKHSQKKVTKITPPVCAKLKKCYISWMLYSMRELLGFGDIRKNIIKTFTPQIENFDDIQTFGSRKNDTKLIKYLELVHLRDGVVVFTASNLPYNGETHYQTYILDNTLKTLYVIDPARNSKNPERSIYESFVFTNTIQPFFEPRGYTTKFIELSSPAQVSTNDIFCQSWSLFILINILQSNNRNEFTIPVKQIDKYNMLLCFFKTIISKVKNFDKLLTKEYIKSINENSTDIDSCGISVDALKKINVKDVILRMNSKDMY